MATHIKYEAENQHPLPRKHVLLLTCMDVRLIDNTVTYMNSLNLTNRYDQVVFAGAALGVLHMSSPPHEGHPVSTGAAWRDVFFHHLHLAIEVLDRNVGDIFIVEHRDCGAYQHYHPTHNEPYGDDPAGQELEEKHHREQAFQLARAIREYCVKQQDVSREAIRATENGAVRVESEWRLKSWSNIRVQCFLMDLRGQVLPLIEDANPLPRSLGFQMSM